MLENLNAFQKYDVLVPLPQLDIQPNLFKLLRRLFGLIPIIHSAVSWEHHAFERLIYSLMFKNGWT